MFRSMGSRFGESALIKATRSSPERLLDQAKEGEYKVCKTDTMIVLFLFHAIEQPFLTQTCIYLSTLSLARSKRILRLRNE